MFHGGLLCFLLSARYHAARTFASDHLIESAKGAQTRSVQARTSGGWERDSWRALIKTHKAPPLTTFYTPPIVFFT